MIRNINNYEFCFNKKKSFFFFTNFTYKYQANAYLLY